MKLVYVLSTEKDMQYEREKLHSFVTKTVNEKLKSYDDYLYLKDLAWGSDQAVFDFSKKGQKLLTVNLDSIDYCNRYMIVLLGDRYGFIPSDDTIARILDKKGLKYKSDISVTELEIAYATLLNEEYKGKVFFYFRELDDTEMDYNDHFVYDSESEQNRKRVETLKRHLDESFPGRVKTYKASFDKKKKCLEGLDKFAFMVASDLEETFERDIQLSFKSSFVTSIFSLSEKYFKNLTTTYYPVEPNNIEEYEGLEYKKNERVTVISGKEGTGKTSLLAYYYFAKQSKVNDGNKHCIPFVTGINDSCKTGFNVFKEIIYVYEQNMGLPHKQFTKDEVYDEDVLDYLFELEREAINNREVLVNVMIENVTPVIIKGITYLDIVSSKQRKDPHKYEGTHYFLTFNETKDIPSVMPFYDYSNRLKTHKLGEKEMAGIIETIANNENRHIPTNIISQITKKELMMKSPLYLNILVHYLLLPDFGKDNEGSRPELLATNMFDMVDIFGEDSRRLVTNFVEDIARMINGTMIMRLLAIITYSNQPLLEKDIVDIFEKKHWNYSILDITLAIKLLSPILNIEGEYHYVELRNNDIKNYIKEFLSSHNYHLIIHDLVEYGLASSYDSSFFLHSFKVAAELNDKETLTETFKDMLIKMNDASNKEVIRFNIAKSFNEIILDGNKDLLIEFMLLCSRLFPSKEFSFLYSQLPIEYPNEEVRQKYFMFYRDMECRIEENVNNGNHFVDFAFLIMITKLLHYYAEINFDDGFTLLNRNLQTIKSLRGIDAQFLDDYLYSVTHLLNKSGVHTLIEKHLGVNPLQSFILDNKSLKDCNKKSYYQSIFRATILVELAELRIQGEILNELTWSMLRDALNIYKEAHNEIKTIWEFATPRDYICQIKANLLSYRYLDFYRIDSFVCYDFKEMLDFLRLNTFIYPQCVEAINRVDHLDMEVYRYNNPNNDLDFGNKHDAFYSMLDRVALRNKGMYLTTNYNKDLEKVIDSMTERMYFLSVNYEEGNDCVSIAKEILSIIFKYCKNSDFNIETFALTFNKIIHCFDILRENEENETIMLYIEQLRNYFIGGHLVVALTSYLFNWYVRNDDMLYQTALLELEESRKEKELDERFELYYDYFEQVLRELSD